MRILLYDAGAHQNTFLAFDASLQLSRYSTVQSRAQYWQILVGSFPDRSRCLARGACTMCDDLLALDHRAGQIQQYAISFGRQFKSYDNRVQAFLRERRRPQPHLIPVHTPAFSTRAVLDTGIQHEEL